MAEQPVAPWPAFELCPGAATSGVIFICDHASPAVPEAYAGLGLAPEAFTRHIAYDIGAAALTRALAARFEAPAVLSHFSRLLIDPNRGLDDPTLIMELSDGAIIPGNHGITEGERATRIAQFWQPYRHAVQAEIARMVATGPVPAIVSLHSFTPRWKGARRPWPVAVLWDTDARMALPLIADLRTDHGMNVGDNQPYDGALKGDTLHEMATVPGLPHVLIELRQDEIGDDAGVARWTSRLEAALRPLLVQAGLHQMVPQGSRAR
ncbi:MAG: N-formylglutamate amidohydrolase [Hyphomicrobiales bacterium]|nr:N-formylglutamate amidohydrolase [Hyphomicrobiales bacterium]